MSKLIPEKVYKEIMREIPVLTVDALIRNNHGKFLLAKRNNKPLQGEWYIPGGRVLKNETLKNAIRRKVKQELGLKVISAIPVGYYEDFFKANPFSLKSGVHTVSIVFNIKTENFNVKLNDEHSDWNFFRELPDRFKIKTLLPKWKTKK